MGMADDHRTASLAGSKQTASGTDTGIAGRRPITAPTGLCSGSPVSGRSYQLSASFGQRAPSCLYRTPSGAGDTTCRIVAKTADPRVDTAGGCAVWNGSGCGRFMAQANVGKWTPLCSSCHSSSERYHDTSTRFPRPSKPIQVGNQ